MRDTKSNGNHISCDRCSQVTGRQYGGTLERDWLALAYHTTFNYLYNNIGFLDGSDGKESACNAGDQVRSLGWENPLEKGMATHSSILT